jgi:hypothetical protein
MANVMSLELIKRGLRIRVREPLCIHVLIGKPDETRTR